MNSRKFILRQSLLILLGELICCAAMVGIFALLGYFSYKVILGSAFGTILAVGNFFFMGLSAHAAADKAEQQDQKGGQAVMKTSYRFRLLILGVLLFVLAKSGHCNLISLVCPLFFTFPIIMVTEFFRKSGDVKS